MLDDGTTFVVTGDIPAMWLRDSSAQVRPYVPLAAQDAEVRRMIKGLVQRQASYILIDAYANAFNCEPNGHGHRRDRPRQGPWIWERKYELDSLCYPIQLLHDYWEATGDTSVFDDLMLRMLRRVLQVMRIEQQHAHSSSYTFVRKTLVASDTLANGGKGTPTGYTGMVWSGFRPSDDACTFGYLIPANMFAVVVLEYVAHFSRAFYNDMEMAAEAASLREEIDRGIQQYGIVTHPRHGEIYAYEVDGLGNHVLMDDANVPSLLSIPYLGYRRHDDPLYLQTRQFLLSADNPFFFSGLHARGIGSPHTRARLHLADRAGDAGTHHGRQGRARSVHGYADHHHGEYRLHA